MAISLHTNVKATSNDSERMCKGERDCDQEAGEPGRGARGSPHTASADLPGHQISKERFSLSARSGQPIVFAVFALQNKGL